MDNLDIDYISFSRYAKLNELLGSNINTNVLYDFLISIRGNIDCVVDYDMDTRNSVNAHYIYMYNDMIIIEYYIDGQGEVFGHNISKSFKNIFVKYYKNEYAKDSNYDSIDVSDFIINYYKYYLKII